MATYKTTGIVIRRFNLGEADRIITFLTPDHGKLKAVAKGVRRIKSRMAGHLELFGEVELMLARGRNLDIITSARLIRDASNITYDSAGLAHGYMFAELIDRLVEEGVSHPELYAGAAEAFTELGLPDASYQLLELFFKLRLVSELGYRPELAQCVVCHRSDAESEYFFVSSVGGIVDRTCTTDRRLPISASSIKFWRLLLSQSLVAARKVTGTKELVQATLPICDDFLEYHFGRRFTPALI
jgi:DNA repair protein RecO (recombination protein O)